MILWTFINNNKSVERLRGYENVNYVNYLPIVPEKRLLKIVNSARMKFILSLWYKMAIQVETFITNHTELVVVKEDGRDEFIV